MTRHSHHSPRYHHRDCEFHHDHYWFECTCGFTRWLGLIFYWLDQ